jgi:hypothetical protein
MHQSRPSHSIGIIISTRLEYELNLIAQSVILARGALILCICFFSLVSNFDYVDFMSTARFGISIVWQ